MWHWNTQKYKNLFNLQWKIGSYQKTRSNFGGIILYFNCEKLLTKELLCICMLWFTCFWIFTRDMLSIKLQCNIDNLKISYVIKYSNFLIMFLLDLDCCIIWVMQLTNTQFCSCEIKKKTYIQPLKTMNLLRT